MTAADRPEVDDPRVLALAKARQQMAHENPFNAGFCPPWYELSEQEQRLSLLDARNYLRAALKAGLCASSAVSVVPPATNQALRDRIAAAVYEHMHPGSHWSDTSMPADWRPAYLEEADAVLAVLPEPADRAALDRVRALHQPIAGDGGPYCQTCTQEEVQPQPVGWWVPLPCPTMQVVDEELRRLAAEAPHAATPDARLEQGRTQLLEAMSAVSEDRTCCGWAADWARTLHAEGGIWETLGRAVGWPTGNYDTWAWVSWDEAAALYAAPAVVAQPGKEDAS